jgi:predicted RNase H-like HicB family nuclease
MELPIAIHKDTDGVYGVTVPDLIGCFSAGDTIDEAIKNVKDAIYLHVEAMLESGNNLDLKPSRIEELAGQVDYTGAIWAFVDVDLAKLDAKPERINISLPRFVLSKIDAYTAPRHETRSGFLARAALAMIASETSQAS